MTRRKHCKLLVADACATIKDHCHLLPPTGCAEVATRLGRALAIIEADGLPVGGATTPTMTLAGPPGVAVLGAVLACCFDIEAAAGAQHHPDFGSIAATTAALARLRDHFAQQQGPPRRAA